MKNYFYLIFTLSLAACVSSNPNKQVPLKDNFSNLKLGSWTLENNLKGDGIILSPQWHLSPNADPKPGEKVPQETNQRAIFAQLSNWIEAHTFDVFLAEGCEGRFEDQLDKKLNGWSTNDLKIRKDIDTILAPIAFKLSAKYSKKIQILCADNEKLIKDHQMVFSNLRGLAGFKTRIEQTSLSTSDRQTYTTAATEILRLPKSSNQTIVLAKLNSEIKKSIEQFENLLHLRNESVVTKAKSQKGIKVTVIGALHINDLQAQLKKENIAFSIWTPEGLDTKDAQLIQELKGKVDLK